MGKNSDHKNIFESYYNNVVLNEQTDLSKEDIVNLNALLKTATGDAKKSIQAEIDKRVSQVATAQQPKDVYKGNEDNSDLKWNEHSAPPAPVSAAPETAQPAQVATQQAQVAAPQPTTGSGEFDEIANLKAALNNPNLDPTLKKIVQDRITELSKQPQAKQAAQPKAQSSGGGSIVDYLASKGQPTDKASRAKLAAQEGIQNYSGTAEQNIQLLNKLKSREKASAQQPATQQAAQQAKKSGGVSKAVGDVGTSIKKGLVGSEKPLGGAAGLVSKGIGSVGNLAKGAAKGASKVIGSAGKGVQRALVGDQDESEEEGFVQFENNHIAKFLKSLSEKDYSNANKYLKTIVDNKINRNVLKNINNK